MEDPRESEDITQVLEKVPALFVPFGLKPLMGSLYLNKEFAGGEPILSVSPVERSRDWEW